MSPRLPRPTESRPTRRGLLAAGGAVGLGALLAACGSGGSDSSGGSGGSGAKGSGKAADSAAGGPWTFTDDRGTKTSLDARPERIVTYIGVAAALHDFGVDKRIVGVFGPSRLKNGKPDPLAGGFDVDRTEIVGNVYNEFALEKYAALRPQLLVTHMYLPGALWFVPDDSKAKIVKLAPTAAIKVSGVSLPEPIRRHEELAASLGADLTAASVTAAKARFEAAAEKIRKAARAAKSRKITVMACSAAEDTFYVSTPKPYADLSYLRELGVEFVVPDKVQGGFFENLSWEKADKYKADVMLYDSRTAALQPDQLKAKPTWTRLPAVEAGQLVPWLSEPRYSYAGCAPTLERIAEALDGAKKVA